MLYDWTFPFGPLVSSIQHTHTNGIKRNEVDKDNKILGPEIRMAIDCNANCIHLYVFTRHLSALYYIGTYLTNPNRWLLGDEKVTSEGEIYSCIPSLEVPNGCIYTTTVQSLSVHVPNLNIKLSTTDPLFPFLSLSRF